MSLFADLYRADNEVCILHFMKYLDAKPLTFAAAYLPHAGELTLLTERDYATNFDPRNFEVFMDAISQDDEGSMIIGFTPDGGEHRDMYLFFMWVPDYSEPTERYLLVAAVSRFSITIKLERWVTLAPLVGVVALFFICCWVIYLKVKLGHIRDMRNGKTLSDKYRPVERGD